MYMFICRGPMRSDKGVGSLGAEMELPLWVLGTESGSPQQ